MLCTTCDITTIDQQSWWKRLIWNENNYIYTCTCTTSLHSQYIWNCQCKNSCLKITTKFYTITIFKVSKVSKIPGKSWFFFNTINIFEVVKVSICLCCGFMAQSTQWGFVEHAVSSPTWTCNYTFYWAGSRRSLTSIVHILSPETADNCPSWISERARMTVENISWTISTKKFADLAGVEPPTSWSSVRCTSNWATKARSVFV